MSNLWFQEMATKVADAFVGVIVVATVEERAAMIDLASTALEALAVSAPGPSGSRAPVLQALIPVVLMASGKPGVPPR